MKNTVQYQFIFALSLVLCALSCSDSLENDPSVYQRITVYPESELGFNVFCNANLDNPEGLTHYKNLLFVSHGGALDGERHYKIALDGVRLANKLGNTIVVAPQFRTENISRNYRWGKYNWKDGRESYNGVPKVSSYAVFDALISQIISKYPSIENIILTGHSAGAQAVFRYAVLTDLPELISRDVNYLPMNPASLLYIGPERWNEEINSFIIPPDLSTCPDYNTWNYGLNNIELNEYRPDITAEYINETFPYRNLTYCVGTRDFNITDPSCEADYLGSTSLDKSTKAYQYMQFKVPDNNHELITVEGIAHDFTGMMRSPEIRTYINSIFE
ncbi:hypothetical protein VOI54_16760 [Tamlana sp. 2201CG12-4]|uniref:hypothetical protein n=1 Tax=Tamlana sp. 2201CG12-4 TaxID=3112582 RepID=UPI002DBE6FAD|nr:hypothetical protein [Tamlana sp. 2201CG12-4]MEC3908681.1 hypothetical protein [Tamlana sp. 2201CG12-4]